MSSVNADAECSRCKALRAQIVDHKEYVADLEDRYERALDEIARLRERGQDGEDGYGFGGYQ